jgi:mannose-6-phosphate isomerase-like protein (cupin superfamily)
MQQTVTGTMIIADLQTLDGSSFPAGRRTQNLVGGASPISCENFCLGYVMLDPNGGQVPWHNHDQEEVYVILDGEGEMCIGDERRTIHAGQVAFIPPGIFHQLTNRSSGPLAMLYCYGPAGDVAHWRQELDGTLPKAGVEAPPLPDGAAEQVV